MNGLLWQRCAGRVLRSLKIMIEIFIRHATTEVFRWYKLESRLLFYDVFYAKQPGFASPLILVKLGLD